MRHYSRIAISGKWHGAKIGKVDNPIELAIYTSTSLRVCESTRDENTQTHANNERMSKMNSAKAHR